MTFSFAKVDASDLSLSDTEIGELDRLMFLGQRPDELIVRHAVQLARRIATKTVLRYPWIDVDDLRQELIIGLPRFLDRYRPDHESRTPWSKNLFFRFSFFVRDILRREDPLGIRWPQRQHYPRWFRLGGESAGVLISELESGCALVGADCPQEMLGRALESDDTEDAELDEWDASFSAFLEFVESQRSSIGYRQARPAILIGTDLLICPDRCWDRQRSRVRFRRGPATRIRNWLAGRRKAKRLELAAMS